MPKIRTTEKPHEFSGRLFKALEIRSLQDLTLDSEGNFTAGVEGVEFARGEPKDLAGLFPIEEWKGKMSLCSSMDIPLYLLVHAEGEGQVEVFRLVQDGDSVKFDNYMTIPSGEFGAWWASIKRTKQFKPLVEAEDRTSYFDDLMAKSSLAWGGNIDGFLLDEKRRPKAIIEARYTKYRLDGYDPADWFHYKGGDYNDWRPLVMLATRFNIPLFLFTFERGSTAERMGFSVLDSESKDGITYRYGPPKANIISGISGITDEVGRRLSEPPPSLN